MKTFELPVSDCGMFIAGVINETTFADMDDKPEHGVVIWYKDVDTMRAAMKALMESHWDKPALTTGKREDAE
jgi:hypothetical protein